MSSSMMLPRGLLSEKGAARPSSLVSTKMDLHHTTETQQEAQDLYTAADPDVSVSGLTGLIKRRADVQIEEEAPSIHTEPSRHKPINHPAERPYWLAPLRNKVAARMKAEAASQAPQPQPDLPKLDAQDNERTQIRRQMTVRLDMVMFERIVGIAESNQRTYQNILEQAVLNYVRDNAKSH